MKSLASQIDDIAVHYILKQNTIDLLRLTDKEYYDNLIVLVGNLFEKRLTDLEIGSMNQRIFPETVQDAVLNLLPSNGKMKDMMISNISKFYIKIMMIFSAIVSTIDPQYSYEDDNGNKQLFYLKDIKSYRNIPKHVQPVVHQLTNPMNLCRKRISILRNKIDSSDPDFITINPGEKLCSTESASYLTDEIGIKELDLLYYDIFDPETKTWKNRSKGMDEKYKEDLKKFYSIFTGKSELPPNINSFKDIELFDFRSIEYCKDTLFTHDFVVPKDNELIVRYKEQVDLLEQSTTIYRAELLETLKKIFLTKIDGDNMSYTIQSSLTLQDILSIENETRNTIINLYTNCEQYFIRALLIFEELYDNQSKNMNESRMNNIDAGFPTNGRNQPLYRENLINMNTAPNIPNRMPPTREFDTKPNVYKSNPEEPMNTYPDSYANPLPPANPEVSAPEPSPELSAPMNQVTPEPSVPMNQLTPEPSAPFNQVPPGNQTTLNPVNQVTPELSAPTNQVTPEPSAPMNQVTPEPSAPTNQVTPEPSAPMNQVTPEPSAPTNQVTPEPSAPMNQVTPESSAPTNQVTPEPSAPTNQVTPEPSVPMSQVTPDSSAPTNQVTPESSVPMSQVTPANQPLNQVVQPSLPDPSANPPVQPSLPEPSTNPPSLPVPAQAPVSTLPTDESTNPKQELQKPQDTGLAGSIKKFFN
jgi:hypothetical protein